MEKFNQEHDAVTGVVTKHGFVDDKLVIRKEADLQPIVDATTQLRNADEYSRQGIKKGFFHVATIDPITQIELRKIGVDLMRCTPKELVAGLKKIGREYLMTTRKQV